MKVTLLGKKYVIRFAHDTKDLRVTTASLFEVLEIEDKDQKPLFVATAFCSKNDNFNRSMGRKLAFSRLLKWMSTGRFSLSKEDRTDLWREYFLHHKK